MSVTTSKYQWEVLRQAAKFVKAAACQGHEWSDEHPNPVKRLRAGSMICTRCGFAAPYWAVFLYEQGCRHGDGSAGRGTPPT